MLAWHRAGGSRRYAALAALLGSTGVLALWVPTTASGAVGHVVTPGESLWSIAAANNLTTRTVAVYNGLAEDAVLTVGQTVQVPTVDEGAAALANAGITPSTATTTTSGVSHVVQTGESLWSIAVANGISVSTLAAANGLSDDAYLYTGDTLQVPSATSTTTATTTSAPAPGLGTITSPYGDLYLTPAAADSWNQMREASLSQYGIDLYPGGPLSAYRTYEEQSYLYNLYLSGQGAPANPPGTSTHNLGIAVDVPDESMRSVIDEIGGAYGWWGTIPSEWWHVQYGG
jgi:LysM repeat protein